MRSSSYAQVEEKSENMPIMIGGKEQKNLRGLGCQWETKGRESRGTAVRRIDGQTEAEALGSSGKCLRIVDGREAKRNVTGGTGV